MSNTCWRCLRHASSTVQSSTPTVSVAPASISSTRSFSNTAVRGERPPAHFKIRVEPQKNIVRGKKHIQTSRKSRLKKAQGRVVEGKPLQEGERKEFRKRVVLSNTNAFDVPSLASWSRGNADDKNLLGQVVSLEGQMIDRLRAIGAFQPKQAWNYFKRPSCVIRPVTTQISELMDQVGNDTQASREMQTARALLIGPRGSGKSVALLQAMTLAFMKDWVVIHIPDAQELVLGHTHYAPLSTPSPSNPTTYNPSQPLYAQKEYTAKLLASISKANGAVLGQMQLTLNHNDLPIPVQANISLDRLADLGANDADISWPIFTALWQELTSTEPGPDGKRRPPILMTLDGIAHVSRLSQYLAPSMHFIHAHDLALVDHFMQYYSGRANLPNGGVILAADSQSNRPESRALDLAIRRSREHKLPILGAKPLTNLPDHDPENPWTPIDPRSIRALRAAGIIEMDGFSKDEARAVLEYFARSGMWRSAVNEKTVSDTWTLAGHGLIGEMERMTIKTGHV